MRNSGLTRSELLKRAAATAPALLLAKSVTALGASPSRLQPLPTTQESPITQSG